MTILVKCYVNKLPKVALIVSLALLVMGLIMPGCSTQGTKGDNRAPDFQLNDIEGKLVSLSNFRGKPVMLNFWATWCGPCVYEMPYLQQIYEEWSTKGLVLRAIDMGESSAQVKEFLQKYNLSLPVLLDTEQEVALRYNVLGIPATFFIDKHGLVQAIKPGAFRNKKEIEDYLSKIMP